MPPEDTVLRVRFSLRPHVVVDWTVYKRRGRDLGQTSQITGPCQAQTHHVEDEMILSFCMNNYGVCYGTVATAVA